MADASPNSQAGLKARFDREFQRLRDEGVDPKEAARRCLAMVAQAKATASATADAAPATAPAAAPAPAPTADSITPTGVTAIAAAVVAAEDDGGDSPMPADADPAGGATPTSDSEESDDDTPMTEAAADEDEPMATIAGAGGAGAGTEAASSEEESTSLIPKYAAKELEARASKDFTVALLKLLDGISDHGPALVVRHVGRHFCDTGMMEDAFVTRSPGAVDIDYERAIKTYRVLQATENEGVIGSLLTATSTWATYFARLAAVDPSPRVIRQIVVVMLNPLMVDPDYHPTVVDKVANALASAPPRGRQLFTEYCTHLPKAGLETMIHTAQQMLTLCLYTEPSKCQAVVGLLSLLNDANEASVRLNQRRTVPHTMFYNDVVNDEVNLEDDYKHWLGSRELEAAGRGAMFSFCGNHFVLDAAAKSMILRIDSRRQMRRMLMQSMFSAMEPFLVLKVARSNVVEDTLVQLGELPSMVLKKPLKVKFKGEEGVDEGGVRKEFFQVLLRQLFDPQYAMFHFDPDTRYMWFNPHCLEPMIKFELVGILLGLAVYNSVILDVTFPLLVYRKLCNIKPTMADLAEIAPDEASGLKSTLTYEGDMEDLDLTFDISTEVWGQIKVVELKEGGSAIEVTKENREEYVELYLKARLTTLVERPFDAFRRGFFKVCGSDILELFRPEELELLVCGSQELDFEALEENAHYEDGFDTDSQTVKWFWEVVHELPQADQRKVLTFATGSDRAPIKGLGSLRFVISRMGPDSDLLPTSHTCFNHLLLPEYGSKAKLEEKLKAAISQSEGFGLL